MNRRRFFSALTSAFAAGAAAPALAQAPTAGPQRIDRLRLDAAESIFGVDFTEAEEQMALGSVNRNLDSYDQLRQLNVPLDTEPALKCGFIDNLPASIMVTGRLYDEATVCRVALAYEQNTEWHKKHPTL